MNKLVKITLENRAVALACSSFAVLLTACGGGGADGSQLAAGTQTVTAASIVTAAPGMTSSAAADAGDTDPDAVMAGLGADVDQSAYAVAGYGPDAAATWQEPFPGAESALVPGVANAAAGGVTSLYVSPQGVDTNPGTAARPFRTIARAAQAARPGTTVYVAPGTYSGGFQTTASGSANARIAYVSTKRWGAKLVSPKNSRNDMAWDNRGSYVDIVGFEVDGSKHNGGTRWTHGIYNGGSYATIRRNHVHHIARNVPCTSAGGSAIGVDSYYRGVDSHVIANLVHDIGPDGCRYVQGIYMSTSGSIKNNVVHRVSEGAIHLWHDARNVIITNNTVSGSNTGIIVGGGDYYHSSGPNDHTLVYSNIVYDNKMGISEQGQTGLNNSYRNNLVYRNTTYDFSLKNGLTHSGTVNQPPKFAGDTKVALPNFSLSAGSPAIGRGTSAYADGTDFNGRPRNASSGYDIGAYQHY